MKSRLLATTATAAAVALALTGCGADASDPGEASSTLTIAASSDNNSFDTAALEIGHRVQYWMPVYDTLLIQNPDAEPEPNLATDWSYDETGTELTLELREGVEFTDGEPFDADAVKANIEHLRAGTGQNAYMVSNVEEIEIVDDHEVVLHLSRPDAGLLNYLGVAGGAMASPAALGTEELATTPVGSGAYVLDASATTPGSQYTYTRNPDYWNPDAYPYDTIVIKPIIDLSARLNALKSGQVNAALADAKSIAEAEASGLSVHTLPVDWNGIIIADRNGETVPALGDVRVRQAINHAFDAEAILQNVHLGYGEVTDQVFNTRSLAFDPELEGAYDYDPERARELLAEAGYPDGFEIVMPEFPFAAAVNPIIEQQFADIGITVDWEKVSTDAAVSELLSGKYPIYWFSLASQTVAQDVQKLATPTSPWNTSKVDDPELMALVEAARAATGDEQRAAFQAISEYFVENAWFDPWYRVDTVQLTDAATTVEMQAQNVVPWPRNFSPAG